MGMHPSPEASYRLEDRFICAQCGDKPRVVKATSIDGQVTVVLSCHGQQETVCKPKSELVHTQEVFKA